MPLFLFDMIIMSLTFNEVVSKSFGDHMTVWLGQAQISMKELQESTQLLTHRLTCEQHFVLW